MFFTKNENILSGGQGLSIFLRPADTRSIIRADEGHSEEREILRIQFRKNRRTSLSLLHPISKSLKLY